MADLKRQREAVDLYVMHERSAQDSISQWQQETDNFRQQVMNKHQKVKET